MTASARLQSVRLGDDTWSDRRLASRAGLGERAVTRELDALALAGLDVRAWPLDRAVVAVKASRAGHDAAALTLLVETPYLSATSWLVSTGEPGIPARLYASLLQATAWIEQHPFASFHLSPVGTLGVDLEHGGRR